MYLMVNKVHTCKINLKTTTTTTNTKKNYKINNTNLEEHFNKIQELVNVSRNIHDYLYFFFIRLKTK